MNAVTRAGALLVFAALLAIGASWYFWMDSMAQMKAESAAAHARLESTIRDCNAAIAAAERAIIQREKVYADTQKRLEELDCILGNLDDMRLPDGLREWFRNSGHACPLPNAAPGAVAGHPDSAP